MIRVILNHWSWSRSPQKKAPLNSLVALWLYTMNFLDEDTKGLFQTSCYCRAELKCYCRAIAEPNSFEFDTAVARRLEQA